MKNLNEKFQSLINGNTGTVYNGIVGTNHEVRSQIVKEVYNALPELISVKIKGIDLKLQKNTSLSGKSVSFYGSLTNEQYIILHGSNFGLTKKNNSSISLESTGEVIIRGGGKYYEKLENKDVNIL